MGPGEVMVKPATMLMGNAAIGRIGEIGHPDVQASIAEAAQDADAAGKPIGSGGGSGSPDMLGRFPGYGYDWGRAAY
jgi:2-keto-3-deoxy-L-rhamnonate aldolase RhmA